MRRPAQLGLGGDLASPSLVELAVSRLRRDILSGVLVPGERIVEEQLTRQFGTSRAPLREALRLLGEQGLVEHLPRRGVRVAQLSTTDVEELFELRDELERFAVHKALGRGLPELTDLDAALKGLDEAARTSDIYEAAEAHRRFHLTLVALAGQRQLLLVYEPLIVKLQLYMAANLTREAQQAAPRHGVRRHQRLRDALVSGDERAVLDELARHGARSFFS